MQACIVSPPPIALVGLPGVLTGEQVAPVLKRDVRGDEVASFLRISGARHVFGALPRTTTAPAAAQVSPATPAAPPRTRKPEP